MTKEEKINEYYKDPVRCMCCGKIIEYDGKQSLKKALTRKYCSVSCTNKTCKKKQIICGIYCIENTMNGKKYIGQSVDIFKRWRQHRGELNIGTHHNSRLQNAWNKYGKECFKFYILKECQDEELNDYEKTLIVQYDTYKNGYNLDLGGTDRSRFTEELKKKISSTRLNFSEEQKLAYIKCHHKEAIPIYQIDFNGNIVHTWMSGAREAARILSLEQSCIWNCVNHRRKTYKQFIWIAVDEYDKTSFDVSDYLTHSAIPKSYDMYSLNGTFVKHYDRLKDVKEDGFDQSSVLKCVRGERESHKGYVFKVAS